MAIGGALLLVVLVCTAQGSPVDSEESLPVEVVVQNLSSQLAAVQAKLTAMESNLHQLEAQENQRVVFTASIGEANVKAASGHIIPFSHVITNVGNSYDKITSAFTAPYDGQYMIFVSVDISTDYRRLDIMKNGHAIIPGHNDAGTDHHIYAGGAITLQAGDEITVNHGSDVVGVVDGGPEAIFCGFRI